VLRSRLVGDPLAFVALLLEHGADPTCTTAAGVNPVEAALAEVGRDAETYYPRRSVGPKQLDRTIELLRNASEGAS
jgi:hypothetical protein